MLTIFLLKKDKAATLINLWIPYYNFLHVRKLSLQVFSLHDKTVTVLVRCRTESGFSLQVVNLLVMQVKVYLGTGSY